MDLSGFSDADLEALASGDMSRVSDDALERMAGGGKADYSGEAQAALEHFGNAASMGYLPQLQAAAQKPMAKALDFFTGQNVSDDLPDYTQRRDENIARMKKQSEEHPYASMAGTIGGTFASAIPAGAAIGKIPGIAKLATMAAPEGATIAGRGVALAGRTAASAGAAGIQGALANPGDTDGEVSPLQLEDRAKGGLFSASIAAPLHLAGEGATSLGKYISGRAKNKAEDLAFRALGSFKRQVNQNRDKTNEIGREVLDSGIVRWMPGSARTLEERASNIAGKTGKELGDLTDELSKLETEANYSGMTRKQIADNIRKKIIVENPQGIPGIDKKNATFTSMIDEFEQDPMIRKFAEKSGMGYEEAQKVMTSEGYQPKPFSFKDLRQAKMNVQGTEGTDGLINWNRLKNADIPIDEQFHRALAKQLQQGEESGADAIEKAFYGKASNRFQNLKDKFKRQRTAAKIAGNKADAKRANEILGLKDAIYGGAGANLGGTVGYQMAGVEGMKAGAATGAAIGALGNKIARDYGSQISAKTLDSISRMLEKSPVLERILTRNPTLIPQFVKSMQEKK